MNELPRLRAEAFRVDDDVDLVGLAGPDGMVITRNGWGMAGLGVAATIECGPGERHRLAQLTHTVLNGIELQGSGRDGTGNAPPPVAFGALPYDPQGAARLLVPAVQLHRQADGTRWAVVIQPAIPSGRSPERHGPPPIPVRPDEPLPSRFDVAAARDPAWWMDLVAQATARIRAGQLRKVVLAREIVVTADRPVDPRPALRRLRAAYPSCYVSYIDGFLCASPELLVSRRGDVVRAHPMAGTAPRLGDPAADAKLAASLLANPNYRHEHRLTIDMVHDTLLPYCSFLDAEPEPSVVAVANVQHLATLVEGRLSRPEPSVLELVDRLHPTPAVGGDPREAALEVQRELEQLDRRRYAGAVGWVDAAGDGEWAVGIRSAEFDGATVRVYAGNGIVADSEPATELAETQAKFAAVLGALVRP
ncbi:MAG: isochorismate synthase [Acidimicrobiales bacterium]|nr:isochorismate synthase [Acidimicrobiales bacterium]